jgi:hypothetical protein
VKRLSGAFPKSCAREIAHVSIVREFAVGRTIISVFVVSVIAIFTKLNNAIATVRKNTGVGTSIEIVGVSIVTLFNSFVNESVTTDIQETFVGARINVVSIAIVTFFAFLNYLISTSEDKDLFRLRALSGENVNDCQRDIVSSISGISVRR